jgi:O-antigen/teichoic acid export membrane protein
VPEPREVEAVETTDSGVVQTAPATLVANTSVMFLARVYLLVASGALAIYAIRTLSTEAYGRFAIASALIMIFGLLSEMGITTIALRELSANPQREQKVFSTALSAELATSVVAAVLMFPVAIALGYRGDVLVLLAIGAPIILLQGLVVAFETPFQSRRVFAYPALVVVVQATFAASVGFVLVASGRGAAGLLAGTLAGYLAAVPIGFVLLRTRLSLSVSLRGAWRDVPLFVKSALPVAATGGMAVIYDRVDVLMVSRLDSVRGAAIYSVPLTILQYSAIVPAIVGTAFFPLLSSLLRTDVNAARDAFGLLFRIFALLSVPIAFILSFGGQTLVTTLFGGRYRDSAGPLAFLAWSVVLSFMNYLFWYCLLAAYREGAKFRIMVFGLALNVALNVVLIPAFGPTGAAVSLVTSDLLVVIWQGVLVRRHLFAIALPALLAKPAFAGITALALAFGLLPISGGLVAGLAAGATYVVVLESLRYVSLAEWEPLLTPVRTALVRIRA